MRLARIRYHPVGIPVWGLRRTRLTRVVASFANGVIRDRAAIQNAIPSQWSNGQTEGQITKLKLVKRQMYGRGKLYLLEARIVVTGLIEPFA